jgi:DNA-binding response OmpR family regulator
MRAPGAARHNVGMRVLVVEDDPGIADGLTAMLRAHGYAADACLSLAQADAALHAEVPDLVLLDLGLPDGDGRAWLRQLRQRGQTMPVIIMTARDAVHERVGGLDDGADDYLVKPCSPDELLARMRVALRRSEGRASPWLRHGRITVDPAAHTVRLGDEPVALRAKEYALLLVLLRHAGQVLTRPRLEAALYGFDDALESNSLEVHVHHLRKKLGDDLVKTVRGVGYFVPRPDEPSD